MSAMSRRARRINRSAAPPGDAFFLDEDQKAKNEAAYGQPLAGDIWKKIILVTSDLTIFRSTVEGAARLTDVLGKLDHATGPVKRLQKAINPKAIDSTDLTVNDI